MTKQPNLQLAQQLLADWWLNNVEITSQQLKEELRIEYPDHIWNQQWVSHFLNGSGHKSTEKDNCKLYLRDGTFVSTTSSANVGTMYYDAMKSVTELRLKIAWSLMGSKPLTKRAIKAYLIQTGINNFNEFDQRFEDAGFVPTGLYTVDKDKFYTYLKINQYWSQSKQQALNIDDMPKQHIKNALIKWYSDVKISKILENPNSEVSKLLQAYTK